MIVIRNKRLKKILRTAIPFVLIPLSTAAGIFLFDDRQSVFITLIVTVLSLLLFLCGFEKKKIGTRRLITVAVMTALSVAGRFLPLFKPVTALTILSGMYLGGEAGFLTGALSALISNFSFGQGPWTPFQMLSWGLIGLFSGFLAQKLKKDRLILLVWGALSGIVFSAVMDIWSVLWYNGTLSGGLYLAALTASLPFTALYAASNVVFLWLIAKPFGEKLERVRIKYGV